MAIKYVSFLLSFRSPIYGEVDNIKLSNALLKLFAENGEKEQFLEMLEKGFQVSTFIKGVPSTISRNTDHQEFIPLVLSKVKIKEFVRKFIERISDEDEEVIYESLKFIRKLEKGKIENVYIKNKHILECIYSNNYKECFEEIMNYLKYNEDYEKSIHSDSLLSLTKTTINRLTNTSKEGELHSDILKFPITPYFIFMKISKEYIDEIKYYMELLSKIGVSKRKSIGYGKFEILKFEKNIDLDKYCYPNYFIFLGKGILSNSMIETFEDKVIIDDSYFDMTPTRFISYNGELSGFFTLLSEFAFLKYRNVDDLLSVFNENKILFFNQEDRYKQNNLLREEKIIVNNPLFCYR